MAIIIEDGKGRGYSSSVSQANRLNVSSKSNPRLFYISRDDQEAYTAVSTDASAAAGDYIMYLKNTSTTKNMFIDHIGCFAANAALWKLWSVTGTASGTTITATNLNLTSGLSAEASVEGSQAVSGLTAVNQIDTARSSASEEANLDFSSALILGPSDAIAIEYDTGTTGAAEATITFHYESLTRAN